MRRIYDLRARFAEAVVGVVAQLVERLVRNEKVAGSIPVGSTSLRPERSGLHPGTNRSGLRLGKPAPKALARENFRSSGLSRRLVLP